MPTDTATLARTNATDLDLDAAVAAVVGPVCERLGIRSLLKGQHLYAVMFDMVSLASQPIPATEAELASFGLALLELAKTLTTQSHVDDRVLARMQLDADLADDHLRGVIAIDGENPSTLDAYANALEKTATLNMQKARSARRRARQIRTTRTTARQRIGVA